MCTERKRPRSFPIAAVFATKAFRRDLTLRKELVELLLPIDDFATEPPRRSAHSAAFAMPRT
jgi:hypothetical protein